MKNCFCKICRYKDLNYTGCDSCESGNIENAPKNFVLSEVVLRMIAPKIQEGIRDYVDSNNIKD